MENVLQLEHDFAKWSGCDNTVACSSGSTALHLALEALELEDGGEVIVPDFTMIACARAITLAGLTPVFVDCSDNLNINPNLIEDAITAKTVAIMVVHVYGRVCDMDSISDIASKYGIPVIEDMAEAHGVQPDARTEVACWSFYKNKIIHGEEGGMCAFKNKLDSELARSLRSLGFTKAHDYTHMPRGWNYRLANTLASLIQTNLADYRYNKVWRQNAVDMYNEVCPSLWRMPKRDANWVYDLRIPHLTTQNQDKIVQTLRKMGIEARHGFKPMHGQAEYCDCRTVMQGGWSIAEVVSREVIYLPLHPDLDHKRVIETFQVITSLA